VLVEELSPARDIKPIFVGSIKVPALFEADKAKPNDRPVALSDLAEAGRARLLITDSITRLPKEVERPLTEAGLLINVDGLTANDICALIDKRFMLRFVDDGAAMFYVSVKRRSRKSLLFTDVATLYGGTSFALQGTSIARETHSIRMLVAIGKIDEPTYKLIHQKQDLLVLAGIDARKFFPLFDACPVLEERQAD
jgi:hypothetical protein